MLDCVFDQKVRGIIFEAILSQSERNQDIQDNPEYNSVLPFSIILKIFAVNMLIIFTTNRTKNQVTGLKFIIYLLILHLVKPKKS